MFLPHLKLVIIIMYEMFQVSSVVQNFTCINSELVGKYRQEMALRKKLHNELVELKGRKFYELLMAWEKVTRLNMTAVATCCEV